MRMLKGRYVTVGNRLIAWRMKADASLWIELRIRWTYWRRGWSINVSTDMPEGFSEIPK